MIDVRQTNELTPRELVTILRNGRAFLSLNRPAIIKKSMTKTTNVFTCGF